MDNVFSKKSDLGHIPPIFVLLLIMMFGLPAIVINYIGINPDSTENVDSLFMLVAQLETYSIAIILQWSAFCLSAGTVTLAFIQYRLTNDKIALIIGLSILFSGLMEGLHTLIINIQPAQTNNQSIEGMVWILSNSVSGITLIVGLLFLLKFKPQKITRWTTFLLLNALLFMIAITSMYYIAFILEHSLVWFQDNFISRPYDSIYLCIYLAIALFVYPSAYKKYPSLLTNCIFYVSITQITIALYLMLLSNTSHEIAYDIAYFLKILVYFIPFSCLLINYIFSYNTILEAQHTLQKDQEKLKYLATRDPLTDLYNRREFENLLDNAIANSARRHEFFALLLIDIDNFKSINDTLGHLHGDYFLKKFSEQLTSLTRRGDILSRIGGDEFTVITPFLKAPALVKRFAERLIDGLNIPYAVEEKLLTGTVSLGIALYPLDGETTEELLKNADIAMYNAKKSGKNTYRCFTEKLSSTQHREAEIEVYLREALSKDELHLVYQPQYNLITQEIIGAEVLLRWNNAILGPISPDEFIPVAENSNLIISIGNWVLQKTCEQAMLWSDKYKRNLLFSINVSPVQFENNNFYPYFKDTLKKLNYPANYLSIEITENLLMKNNETVSEGLTNIGALGTLISLDDFGMGYSSLSRLQSLPINTLKIDKLFVSNIHNKISKVVIIDTMIKLAHELGMSVIAEGIETEAQLNYLVSKNCFLGQGYLFNKPLPADQFEKIAYASQ